MRVRYTPAQRAEVLAIARLAGKETAAEKTGIPVATVTRWIDRYGTHRGPELPTDRLEAIRDAADARVERDLLEGKIRGVQAATVSAITRRVLRDERKGLPQNVDVPAVDARERFGEWLIESTIEEAADEEAWHAAIGHLPSGLLVLANREAAKDGHDPWDTPAPHRSAMLAWFSGRPEIPAGDVLEWAQQQTQALIREHGSLVAWHRWRVEQDAAERAARDAEAERAKQASLAAKTAQERAGVDALLAAAEAYLKENAA